MAAKADWIKMRSDLYRHPKVILMASGLMRPGPLAEYVNQNCQCSMAVTRNVMRNATVGALVSVWGVMRHRGTRRGDDLFVSGVGISVVDDIADMDGFNEAMTDAGWLIEEEDGLVFPRFFADHNVDPDEKNRERQRKFRDKKRNVTRNVTVTPDNCVTPSISISLSNSSSNSDFSLFWNAFPKGRRKAKGSALKSWKLARAKVSAETLISAATDYAESEEGRGQFVKMPSTWLNQECWDDDRESWRSKRDDDPRGSMELLERLSEKRRQNGQEIDEG